MSDSPQETGIVQITVDIVAAFVSNNSVRAGELPSLIEAVHTSLGKTVKTAAEEPAIEAKLPAVPVKKSIMDDYIICLEDGKRFKSLKRHLSTAYDMTPDEYRAKWGLSRDYPMVAPAYASARSNLARQMGLGRKRDESGEPRLSGMGAGDTAASVEAPAPRKRGRPRGPAKAAE